VELGAAVVDTTGAPDVDDPGAGVVLAAPVGAAVGGTVVPLVVVVVVVASDVPD